MILAGLEIVTIRAAVDVRLNDLPIAIVGKPDGFGRAFVPVPAYIVAGQNSLAARITPMAEEEGSAEIRIAVFDEGDDFFSGAGRELTRIDWISSEGETVRKQAFISFFGPARWAWHQCERWDEATGALADASGFVSDLAKAYFSSDAAWIELASEAKLADLGEAFSAIPIEQLRDQIAYVITNEPPKPLPSLPPPTPVLFAEGRLLALYGHDGGAYLRKGGEEGTGAEVLLGKLNGVWQIIR